MSDAPPDPFAHLEHGSTEVTSAYAPAKEAPRAFALRVVEGPDAGLSVTIDDATASPLLVGQSPACALRLTDRQVSRRHVAFELALPRLRVVDLGSTNGTFVAGVAIEGAFLCGGERVRVGSTTILVTPVTPPTSVELAAQTSFGRVLGASAAMRRLYPLLERLAASNVPVVIEGETGTGKEAVAEMLHACGARAGQPFIVFDCTAVPPNLVESELFGHDRGAFTGAIASRKGVFELAHGGTLLIDEIGDLEPSLQPKLLRAIERSEIRRVGSEKVLSVDVRLLAATRRNLDEEVQAGRFRDDLFYRLAVGRVELPPLRRRQGDVRLLARHFWTELGGDPAALREDVLRRWELSAWPGNVRQLRNTVARELAVGDLSSTDVDDAAPPSIDGDYLDQVVASGKSLPVARLEVVREFERRYIASVLARFDGNVARAAEASGIARRYFQILRRGTRRSHRSE